jgi:hypothetical protein
MRRTALRLDPLQVSQADLDRAKRWPIGQGVTVTTDDGSVVETQTRSAPWQTLVDRRLVWVILLDVGGMGTCPLARVAERS